MPGSPALLSSTSVSTWAASFLEPRHGLSRSLSSDPLSGGGSHAAAQASDLSDRLHDWLEGLSYHVDWMRPVMFCAFVLLGWVGYGWVALELIGGYGRGVYLPLARLK